MFADPHRDLKRAAPSMKGILVRVAVDQSFGHWNGPVDPDTGRFCYVPIPEGTQAQRADLSTFYRELEPVLATWPGVKLPDLLALAPTHLDPDFAHLTYGDNGTRRGRGIAGLNRGDFVVFYSGLRPVRPTDCVLVYALIGLMRVHEVVPASSIPEARRGENAHTRRASVAADDIVLRATPDGSGRFSRCLRIGSFRDKAYRVLPGVLDAWGGLSCRGGYIQRSAVPPTFLDPERFLRWLAAQDVELMHRNN